MTFRVKDTASLLYGDAASEEALFATACVSAGRIIDCNPYFSELFKLAPSPDAPPAIAQLFGDAEAYATFAQILQERQRRGRQTINWPFLVGAEAKPCRVFVQRLPASTGPLSELWLIEDLGQRIADNEQLAATLRELAALLRNAPVGIIYTAERRLRRANPCFCRMFGYSETAALQLKGQDLFPDQETYAALGRHAFPLLSSGQSLEYEAPMKRANGEIFWAKLIAFVLDPHNPQEGTIWIVSDQSDLRAHQAQLEASLRENQIILDSAVVGIVYLKQRRVVRCNPMAEKIFGYEPGEMLGVSTRDWYESDAAFQEIAETVYPAIRTGERYTQEHRLLRKDGTPFWGRLSGQILDQDDPIGGPSIWIVEDSSERHAAQEAMRSYNQKLEAEVRSRTAELHDLVKVLQKEISEREAVEAQIRIMAHFDSLTGLPNRNLFNELLQRALAGARRERTPLALMFIDLDRFKQINDTLGHAVGDQLLKDAAGRMAATLRGGDTLARFGGDEFVLLCPDLRVTDDLAALAERLLKCFQTPFDIAGQQVATTPSIGIACYPEDGEDGESLLRHADQAMYEAKLAGKNTFRFYLHPEPGKVAEDGTGEN